ncbi:uncharacterized protein PgNI_07483 [Pyricularia grisea]|uniref:Uncharacterized protein n=1 Tax=Pyricularia grisea TaxID=148305 RepID=A0A6P8B0G2_PYRGI|nr:uncharacterized protein PgNI_07483 [Pyricularia grisea]TLD08319.1 hypothetical protein PgNI_07483 [Pyricularia grisea]
MTLDRCDGLNWEVFDCFDSVTEGEPTVHMLCNDTSDIGLSHNYSETFVLKHIDQHVTCPNLDAKLDINAETAPTSTLLTASR